MPEDALTKAAREWDKATQALTLANKAAKQASTNVAECRAKVLALLDSREQRGVVVDDVRISRTELEHGTIQDRAAFEAWCREWDGEAMFEPEPRLRKDNLNQLVRERLANGEALPPGVGVFIEEKISKRKVA
jgi:hypothetical protein